MASPMPTWRSLIIASLFSVLPVNLGLSAQSQAQARAEPSLAEQARKLSAEQAKEGHKPVKVFTNDNIPTGPGGISVVGPAPNAIEPGEQLLGKEQVTSTSSDASSKKHGEKYYRKAMSELSAKLEMHRRELAVLQQKLNLNQVQYYPDPNKTLRQEYSRSDINKLQKEVEEKQQEIAADEKAISDLEAQLRREGGEPGWLRAGPVPETGDEPEAQTKPVGAGEQKPNDRKGTREYWQSRFKYARQAFAKAEEEQRLAEDELNLLQIQQARELNAEAAGELEKKIAAKKTEVDSKSAATAKAQQALDALEKELADSGAPEDWSKTE